MAQNKIAVLAKIIGKCMQIILSGVCYMKSNYEIISRAANLNKDKAIQPLIRHYGPFSID